MSLFAVSFFATCVGMFGLVVVALFVVSTFLCLMVLLEPAMLFIESTVVVLIEEFGILFTFVDFMNNVFSFYRMSFVETTLFFEFMTLLALFALFLFLVVPVSTELNHQTYRSNTQYVSMFFRKTNEM